MDKRISHVAIILSVALMFVGTLLISFGGIAGLFIGVVFAFLSALCAVFGIEAE